MKGLRAFTILIVFTLFYSFIAMHPLQRAAADDDEREEYDHEEYENHEGYEEHENDDDDDDEYEDDEEEYGENRSKDGKTGKERYQVAPSASKWNEWIKADIPTEQYGQTPIQEPDEIKLGKDDNTDIEILVVPYKGQLYVPLVKTATYLGADVVKYEKEHAAEMRKGDYHLIMKLGSRVVYEKMKKTPMPQSVLQVDSELYVPVSVLAGGLGYDVSWDDGIHLKEGK